MSRPGAQAYKRKLIEVAIPLEAINAASSREKSIRHGHPSTLHLWWARRPLASARAVLFASLVDDPSSRPEEFPTEIEQDTERQRLFELIEELVLWENSNNELVLERAGAEIRRCVGDELPTVYDPFAGGGSIPLEAQRLGLPTRASDLNPVAVLINKAMIEIPPRFSGRSPVNPSHAGALHNQAWHAASGLAEDVRYYGQWMRDEAFKRIGHLYPQVELPKEHGGGRATVIAWLWARTVPSPDPAFGGVQVPLISSFWLSKKSGNQAWIEPIVDSGEYYFEVRYGKPKEPDKIAKGTKRGRGANFECIVSGSPMTPAWIKGQGCAGKMNSRLMAVVAEGLRGRLYLSPTDGMEEIAQQAQPTWRPEQQMPTNPRWFSPPDYGMETYGSLFTPRQLTALTTFSDLIAEAMEKVREDAVASDMADSDNGISEGGSGAKAYAEAVGTYLAFAVDRLADRQSSIASWDVSRTMVRNTFGRQAIPMTWDYAEGNPFSESTGNFVGALTWIFKVINGLPTANSIGGMATQRDVNTGPLSDDEIVVVTDPPYYDNIGYADLSDYFYVWLRRCLKNVYPDLFTTVLVPKSPELVATPYRFDGDKKRAENHFESGMLGAFERMYAAHNPAIPLSLYYAFKQAERTDSEGIASTGWETMLNGLISSGFQIVGTWPMRTELSNRAVASGTNALASSIVLVCRKRPTDAPITTRGKFISELKLSLTSSLNTLQETNIPPVDLQQAAIGPGMAVYSKYREVREAEGTMSVHNALVLIISTLDEILSEDESDMDDYTRWAVTWFEQYGLEESDYGVAEVLANAKAISVSGMVDAGFLHSRAGKVRLLRREELSGEWSPETDKTFTVWEAAQYLVKAYNEGGEEPASLIFVKLTDDQTESAKALCYRLYNICDRNGWSEEAVLYNALISSFSGVAERARNAPREPKQTELL